jgi:hypothetical protein
MKSDALISYISAEMIAEHGAEAEQAALELAAFMRDLGERERQAEWLRVRTAIIRLQSGSTADAILTAAV